ncbi:viperin family antiviral radical SAM protein [Spirulina sp. CS-785/01]|uniref:viperin family antiviral radical SAM protein n=1 Tax=Spirulina sp. CS-785/01 TaxID=3021716 RepID=UPI00232BF666|nr:viperin family antiviral radical SAM protein [Spirulina sp. CS-785/01]MDB9312024.1 viperin family antiviral radical SAM protein [Spirulina sp. CS-785/01]
MRYSSSPEQIKPISVNFHLWKHCNYNCIFCYETMPDIKSNLSLDESLQLLKLLRQAGCQKINFAGGEPTLCPYLGELLVAARHLGLVTSIVTNGAKLSQLIQKYASYIDWVALSIDSGSEITSQHLGRGKGNHVKKSLNLAALLHEYKIRVKLNTVITRLNYQEDMSDLVQQVNPERWKIFQVLAVQGQTDKRIDDLLISSKEFNLFVEQHQFLLREGIKIVAEDNQMMQGSYIMVDPIGRFFSDAKGYHEYSQPILQVGVETAFAQVQWNRDKFIERGGIYNWRKPF